MPFTIPFLDKNADFIDLGTLEYIVILELGSEQ
jgi:hypothetical protein